MLELEFEHFKREAPNIRHVEVLKQGLHNEPDRLRSELQAAIDRVEAMDVGAIVLGYGLCSRGTEGVRTKRCLLVVPRAHDCITLLLGCKDRYAKYAAEHPGTYWYSPGWNKHGGPPGKERYENCYKEYREKYGADNAEFLMQTQQQWYSAYSRATYVDLGVGATEQDLEFTRQCAAFLKWRFDRQHGDPKLLRDMLTGPWDEQRFLVLEPGQSLRMTADERVMELAPPQGAAQATAPRRDWRSMPRTLSLRLIVPEGERELELSAAEARGALTEVLRRAGMPLNTRCGERGLCDGCVVELVQGAVERLGAPGGVVKAGGEALALRACEHRLGAASATLRISQRAMLAYEPHVLAEFALNVPHAVDPLVQFAAPSEGKPLGVAMDVGTTTIVVLLVDLSTGKPVGQASGFNRQMHLGDDVLTRINLCTTDPRNVQRLRRAVVVDTIRPLLQAALKKAEAGPRQIAGLTAAGNTTMLHLLAGVDPSPLGVVPFTPVFLEHREARLSEVGLPLAHLLHGHLHDAAAPGEWDPPLHLLPGAAAYVGADLVAGTLASGLAYDEGPSLLVDVGTNGEIILKHGSTLLGCATAAGPAFEGAGLTDGIRAGQGAIDHVRLAREPFAIEFDVINNGQPTRPVGLCGSAYVDLLAEGRRVGLLTPRGRFDAAAVPGSAQHLDSGGHSRTLRVATANGGKPIVLAETDVAALLQAKAAIAAGVLTLLEHAKLAPGDVRTLYLAGGFGMHLNIESAFGCGLLPGFRRDQVKLVGNSSLAGAYLALVDRGVLPELQRIARSMQVIELNLEPGFEDRYIDQLSLP